MLVPSTDFWFVQAPLFVAAGVVALCTAAALALPWTDAELEALEAEWAALVGALRATFLG